MKKVTTEQFIIEARKAHGDIYDYSMSEYIMAKKHIKVVCQKHGQFLVTPDNHLRRLSGCPKCAYIIIGGKVSLRLIGKTHNNFKGSVCKRKEDFLSRAKRIHADKYDYSLVEYKSSKKIVKIICKKHGVFETLPSRHLLGAECFKCSSEERRKTQSEFINNSVKVHGNKYNYDKVIYHTSKDLVIIVCPKHGEFKQKPNKHLSGQGCYKCRSSHVEREVRKYLTSISIVFEEQKTFLGCVSPISNYPLKFDFYIPSLITCVEFDGEQHFRPWKNGKISIDKVAKTQLMDHIKDDFCKANGIRILRIPYYNINKVSDILKKELS